MEEAEGADLAVGALLAEPRGTLRVGAPVPFARLIMGPMLGDFLAKYPRLNLHVDLVEGDAALRAGHLDLVIRAGALEDSGLLVKPLMRVLQRVYASPAYREKRPGPESPEALRQMCIRDRCRSCRHSPGQPPICRAGARARDPEC